MSFKFRENSVSKMSSSITITSNGTSSNHTCKVWYYPYRYANCTIFVRYVYVKGTTILNVGIIPVYWVDMFRSACNHLQVLESSYIQYATYSVLWHMCCILYMRALKDLKMVKSWPKPVVPVYKYNSNIKNCCAFDVDISNKYYTCKGLYCVVSLEVL